MSKVKITIDDEKHEFELETSGPVILDMAIEKDVDPPFSCRGGVCTSCRAKIIKGSAKMEQNFALTDEEIAEGYILTCQAHPTSEELEISYDD